MMRKPSPPLLSVACSLSWKRRPSPDLLVTSTPAVIRIWTPVHSAAAPPRSNPTFTPWQKPVPRAVALGRLRIIGLEAEAAMFAATAGINTHRGAIFGLGLLCAAAGAAASGRTNTATPTRRRRRAAVGPRYSGRARAAAQPWRRGTQTLWSRRRSIGGVPGLPERLRDRFTSAPMRRPARALRCGSGAGASLFCAHCHSGGHQSSAPRRPVRPLLCPARSPRFS